MPEMEAAKRGNGQQVTPSASRAGWKAWTCHECGRSGREVGTAAARNAFERHWLANHQEVDF